MDVNRRVTIAPADTHAECISQPAFCAAARNLHSRTNTCWMPCCQVERKTKEVMQNDSGVCPAKRIER